MATHSAKRSEDSKEVVAKLQRLQRAVSAGGQYFDPFVSARAQDDLRRAEERMRLGMDVTVAALVGGTGSGKSTLFNAITGLDFADPGELRPTTERAAACTWNADATALLDYLEVDDDRRIEHESILTEGTADLDGLVLLDLPDHDSVALGHSALVERLIPMVDLLIWVLDPQKYADQVLHQDYLGALKQRSDSMIVVINQIDTIPAGSRDVLVDDVRKLLTGDGLGDVPIYTASALNGEGVDAIRDRLGEAVAGPSSSARTAAAELDAISTRLRSNLGAGEPSLDDATLADINDRIVRASGIPAVEESIRESTGLTGTAFVVPEQPANTMVTAIRDSWVAHVRHGLPKIWQDAVTDSVSGADRLRRAIGNAIRTVPLPSIDRTPSVGLVIVGVLLFIAGIVLAIIGVPVDSTGGRIGVAVAGLVLGLLCWWIARRRLVKIAGQSADEYGAEVRDAVAQTVDEHLVAGPRAIIDRHRVAREALN